MREAIYTPRAETDLVELRQFTSDRWDLDQADTHTGLIPDTCTRLAAATLLGTPANDIQSGLRQRDAGSYIVFHQETPDVIVAIRILLQRMDASSQIED